MYFGGEESERERMRPGDTHTRSANNRRALSLCGARYYKHQNGPQPYINRHFPSASPLLHFLSTLLCSRVSLPIANNHPFGQPRTFLAFSSRGKPFRGKTSIKLVPLERYEALVFRLLLAALRALSPPCLSRFFPRVPPR